MAALGVAALGCEASPGEAADPTGTTLVHAAAATTTTVALPPGVLRTATGAAGAPRDERIGPPGNDRPVSDQVGEGDCYNEFLEAGPDQTVALRIVLVPCGDPHDAEVVGVYGLTEVDLTNAGITTQPGVPLVDRDLRRAAIAGCLGRFEAFVSQSYAISTLRVSARRPSPDTWAAGDRTVVCSAYNADLEPLSGSVRNSRR